MLFLVQDVCLRQDSRSARMASTLGSLTNQLQLLFSRKEPQPDFVLNTQGLVDEPKEQVQACAVPTHLTREMPLAASSSSGST